MEPFGRDLECAGVDDLGLHLLDARYPLEIPNGSPREATVDSKLLERYVGYYELAPTFILTVTREGNQLYTQGTGQPRIAAYGKSDREFFAKVVDAQISFQEDTQPISKARDPTRSPLE